MGLKITNGYKLDGITTLVELQSWWRALVPKITERQEAIARQAVGALAVEYFDFDAIGRERPYPDATPYVAAAMEVVNLMSEAQKSPRRSMWDLGFSLCIIPVEASILVLLYTDCPPLESIFEEDPRVTPYPYLSVCDKPGDISQEEWDQRAKDWATAISTDQTPSHNGFTLSVREPNPLGPLPKEIPQHPAATRARSLARSRVISDYLTGIAVGQHCSPGIKAAALKYADGEGRSEADRFFAEYLPKLKDGLTLADLNRPKEARP